MAFVEADTPESLYLLLKLHHTYLEGRRMNVERSAGGGSERRKQKIQQFRQEQEAYFEDVIDKILQEYKKTGELREDELDEGVIGLCRRHSATVVQAALTRYIEGNGRDMDNPSAFLSHLVTKFAEEGIFDEPPHKKGGGKQRGGGNDNSHDDYYKNKRRMTDKKEGGSTQTADASSHKKFKISSEFGKAGINMSASENVRGGNSSQLTSIFPSARRGRGRGH
uniref:Uncharacterized protein n=1 Tax=Craspedostauros australis TaxID=1486917 RepID=A0A7R9ZQ95_9STRA